MFLTGPYNEIPSRPLTHEPFTANSERGTATHFSLFMPGYNYGPSENELVLNIISHLLPSNRIQGLEE